MTLFQDWKPVVLLWLSSPSYELFLKKEEEKRKTKQNKMKKKNCYDYYISFLMYLNEKKNKISLNSFMIIDQY